MDVFCISRQTYLLKQLWFVRDSLFCSQKGLSISINAPFNEPLHFESVVYFKFLMFRTAIIKIDFTLPSVIFAAKNELAQ